MKKIILFILIFVFGLELQAQHIDSIGFSMTQISLTTENGYTRVFMQSCGTTSEIGHPELPCVVLKYVLPYDQEISSITILDSTLQLVSNNSLIYPKQPDYPIDDTTTHTFILPDMSIYNNSTPYPLHIVEVSEQYYEKGYHLASIKIFPIRYTPSINRLELFSHIRFQLNYSLITETAIKPLTQSQRLNHITEASMLSQIRNQSDFILNSGGPITVLDEDACVTRTINMLDMGINANPEYIIITNNNDVNGNSLYDASSGKNMTDVFQELADWKTQKGTPTKVVTIDEISANYSGNDIQEKIHNFLSDVYHNYGSLYVLFGGDVNVVPARMIPGKHDGHSYNYHLFYPADLYYVAIDNSWDANKNGVYGESVDNADDHPDFYYGRAPVETVIEASTFVLKCEEYETLSEINPIDRLYVNNIVGLQAYLSLPGYYHDYRMQKMEKLFDYVNSNNNLHSGISQNNIVRWRGYDPYDFVGSVNYENYHFNLSKSNALACFGDVIPTSNDKRSHIILHCDHSSYLSLGTSAKLNNMTVDRYDMSMLSNNPFYQILFTVGCSPGEYDKDCIVERLLNNTSAGAVAVCASSQTSIVGEEDMFATFVKDLYDYEEDGVISSSEFFKLGVIHSRAASSYSTFNVYIRKNHLFGDPELPIWTREPVDLSVSTTPSIITNQDNELTVNVSGMVYSGLSTNDVDVCVMKDNEIYLREHYDGTSPTHNFVFNITPETAGDLKVTVTGHNYIPYETTVPVNITGKNVYISNKTVLDATGNNDGNLDAGESANLSISLKNNGTVNLANVTATLSCEFFDENMNQNINEYLTLATPTVNYGTIAQNATVTKNDFQLALSNAIPDRTSLRCTLTISDGSGGISERSFTLLVRAPEIEYVSVRHMERPNGRIILDIELNNLGNGTAKGITATLASSDVQITEGMATYGEMSHLEAITRPFEFIPNGNGIDGNAFTLIVNDAYNKSWSFNLTLFNVPNTVENLTFENAEHSIKLNWDPVGNSRGYYVYRSMTSNGNYERLNRYPISSAFYSDLGMEVKHTYYYAVSYLDEHGNESGKALITAWTSLPVAEGWPVSIPDGLGRAWGTAPNVADIDGDGKQEIFLTTGTGDQQGNLGAIIGLNCIGEELYDIDHNPTTISGFANIHVSMTCTPAIADIDNDGIEEIVVATRSDLNGASHKLCVYKNRDADNDGVPDLAWERPIDYKNFNGVTLSDLDDDGFLEIIVPNQGNNGQYGYTYLEIFDCFGNYYYPKNTIAVINTNNHDRKAVTMAVVADFDNDGHKEIAFGLEGGVYLWRCGSQTLSTLVPCQGRMDCPIIAADIDNDENLEILYMVIKDKKGYIYAIKSDASTVSGWDDDSHFIPIKGDDLGWEWPPYFSVGDIDNDGSIEVFIADKGRLKMWGSDGAPFGLGEINIPDLDCRYFQPVIADVDGNGDCEIIIPSQNGYIYAFKSDGETVSGWPLTVADLATIPVVTDIDNDGYNEVVASSKTEIYVWHTEGESKYNHFDRFRYNKYNNAIYEIPCSYVETPIEIMGTQIWNDNRFVNRHVIINKGAHLTVKSELKFSEEAKIIVKPGGRLILDGCKLTSSCPDEMWQGIEVWGNKNTHQYAVNGQYSQGYVELRNGATIENAECALALWRPGYWGTTGGIVHAEDAVFRNNHRAIHALHYRNHSPVSGKETGYNATFTRCQFTVDGNYPGDGDHVFHKHVDLDHVRGFKFRACDFSVAAPSENISQWTSGIAGYEAGFSVSGLCENSNVHPCPSYDNSTFSGFFTAVSAVNIGAKTPPAITVMRSSFAKNDYGIYTSNLSNATVAFCDFDVKRQSNRLCGAGIFCENMFNHSIEENLFAKSNTFSGEGYGVVIKDCAVQSRVYRNGFENLHCGNLAWGRNMLMKSSDNYIGLEYGCNTNAGNAIDFYVLREDGVLSGIQSSQGSGLSAARNTFSADGYHFYNGGDYKVGYYYYDTTGHEAEEPQSYNSDKLVPIPTGQTDGCPSNYSNGPVSVVLTPAEKRQREQDYYEAYTSYNSLKAVYDSHVDGGSTAGMLGDIASAASSDMWTLREQLLGASPYLSSDVLQAASDRDDVFTESVLFEILLSNPDELKKDSLMDYLRNRETPLPQYMMDILEQVSNGTTAKTVMQNRMSAYRRDYSRAAGDIVRSLVNDTVLDITELRGWLGNLDDIHADRDIISTYVDEGDFADALALAAMLPGLYNLTGKDLAEHDGYVELIELYRDLYHDGRNTMQLDSTERALVENIAEQGTGYPQAMAQAVLHGTDWESYTENPFDCPVLSLPEGGRGMARGQVYTQEDLGRALGMGISLKPNPATTWVAVDYTLPGGASKATLVITNALSITVMSTELDGSTGQKVLDLRGLADGVYVFKVRCRDFLQTGKLVITK